MNGNRVIEETRQSFRVGEIGNEREISLRTVSGRSPGVIWLGGFRSDMTGTKAEAMMRWAFERGVSGIRFDYSGHGDSGGEFEQGSISKWLEETLAVFLRFTVGPQIIIGSSMGGWIALRLIQRLQELNENHRVLGLVLIAPAADFTSALMEPGFSEIQRALLATQGYFEQVSEYSDEPLIITQKLIEDGRKNSILGQPLNTDCPVHIIQGRLDPDVPYQHALRLIELLGEDDVSLSMISDGDHRLSRPEYLELLTSVLDGMIANV